MTVWVFGDSLSSRHGLKDTERSWSEILADRLGTDCVNFARSAADNLYIYHCYLDRLAHIQSNDIVIAGWSHPSRKSFVFDENNSQHISSLPRSFVYDNTDIKFIRSRNPPTDTTSKWLNFKPEFKGNPYYDAWFRDYYSETEQKINLIAYYNAVKSTCPGVYVPFFFSKQSIEGLDISRAGCAVDFIIDNDCAISKEDAHFNSRGHQLWAELLYQYIISQRQASMFPVIELVDRLAIAEVKWERTKGNHHELEWYKTQMRCYDISKIASMLNELKKIHHSIWDKEALLKSGREQELSMDEIGRRAIAIRNLNNQRVALKNAMAERLNCNVREIKQDHLSE